MESFSFFHRNDEEEGERKDEAEMGVRDCLVYLPYVRLSACLPACLSADDDDK